MRPREQWGENDVQDTTFLVGFVVGASILPENGASAPSDSAHALIGLSEWLSDTSAPELAGIQAGNQIGAQVECGIPTPQLQQAPDEATWVQCGGP